MNDITPMTRQSDPADRVKSAVNEARRRGHHVSADAEYTGVVLASTHVPTWERDPRTEVISPLGAVLLVAQPSIASMDDALAVALGTQIEWHLGYELGVTSQVPSEVLNKSPRARLASDGYRAGAEMRAVLHRQGVPVARPAVEKTDRIPYLAHAQEEAIQRVAALQLLDGLSISVALELVAEVARARMLTTTDGRVHDELDLIDGAATELASGARDQGL